MEILFHLKLYFNFFISSSKIDQSEEAKDGRAATKEPAERRSAFKEKVANKTAPAKAAPAKKGNPKKAPAVKIVKPKNAAPVKPASSKAAPATATSVAPDSQNVEISIELFINPATIAHQNTIPYVVVSFSLKNHLFLMTVF